MPSKDVIWNTNCDILEEYCRQFGTCNCPQTSVCVLPDGSELRIGAWVGDQRKRKKSGVKSGGSVVAGGGLSAEREARLQKLVDEGKFRWDAKALAVDASNWDWESMFEALLRYGQRYGTCNVSAIHPMEDGTCVADPGEAVSTSHVPSESSLRGSRSAAEGRESPEREDERANLWLWITEQRRLAIASKLSERKRRRLQALVDQGLFRWDVVRAYCTGAYVDRDIDVNLDHLLT